jgi:hypothetical protein
MTDGAVPLRSPAPLRMSHEGRLLEVNPTDPVPPLAVKVCE